MSQREALYDLLESMTDEEIEALWSRLRGQEAGASPALDLRDFPVLREIWDNDEDAVYDALDEG